MKKILMVSVAFFLFVAIPAQTKKNFHGVSIRMRAVQNLDNDIQLIKILWQLRNDTVYFTDVFEADYKALVTVVKKEDSLFSVLRSVSNKKLSLFEKIAGKNGLEMTPEKEKLLETLEEFYAKELGPVLHKIKMDRDDFYNWKKWGHKMR